MSNSCPICFEEIIDKSRASLDICDHIFCLPCLEKWSKHGSYCPVDRKRFTKIISLDSEIVIQVKPLKPKQQRVLYDVTVYCEVCKKHNNAGTLLLCDCCDLGYHCKCLTPPLKEVPAGQWYCPVCAAVEVRINTAKGSTKEVQHMVEDCRKSENLHDKSNDSGNNNLPDSQTSIARNAVGIDNIPEPSLKKTAVLTNSKNEKHVEHCQNLQDIQKTDPTNQSSIKKSFTCSQDQHTQKEEVSMVKWKKENRKHIDFKGKTINVEDASSAVKSSNASSELSIQDKKKQNCKKGSGSTRVCKKDDSMFRNSLRETKDSRDDYLIQSSTARNILNRKEQSANNEIASTSLSKEDNINLRDCHLETIDIEDSSSAVQHSIARSEKYIEDRRHLYVKKETGSTGLSRKNDKRLRDCLIELIDIGGDSPSIENNIAICIQNKIEKHIKKESTDLSKKFNRKLRDCHIEVIDVEDDSPASFSYFACNAGNHQNILEIGFKTPIASTSRKKMDEKKSENFQETIFISDVSPAYKNNTARNNKKTCNEVEQQTKMEIVLKDDLKKDSSNWKNLGIRSYSPENQSDAAKCEGSIHDSQKEDSRVAEKEIPSSFRQKAKRKMKDQQEKAISFKNNSSKYSIATNESSIHSSQKHSKEISELITLSKKKEKISKLYHGETKNINDHGSLVFQTNISISENGIQGNQEQHLKKKNAQTSLKKLKDSLILELEEKNSNIRIDSCTSTITAPHCKTASSSASEQSSFRKKNITNYSETTNFYVSSLENKVGRQSKSSDNWHLGKHQKKVSCKESGMIDQQKVLMNSMPLLDGSPLNTALTCNDRISSKNFQSTNAPINNSCDINNSTKDNFDESFFSSHFSVFETLEDTFVSSQKYLNINRAVREMGHTTTNSFSLFSKNIPTPKKSNSIFLEKSNFLLKHLNSREILGKNCHLNGKASVRNSDLIENPSQNYNIRQVNYAIKAKLNLAEELKKIEKEKWTSSLKKHKHPRLFRSAIPDKLRKDLFNFHSASVSKQI